MAIVLANTDETLEIYQAESPTTDPSFICTYTDYTATAATPGREIGTLADGGDKTIVSAPGASTQRVIETVCINNLDAAAITLTPMFDEAGTEYAFGTFTVNPGEQLIYAQGSWRVLAAGSDASFSKSYENLLINGGFDFAQRTTPGTLTTVATDAYGPDRWRMARETASFQFKRFDATGESGLTCKNYGQFYSTAGGKIHICQIIEGVNSVPLRSKAVTFQAKLKADTARTYRMAVIELQNAGTIDTIPATFCTDLTTGTGTDPTLGTNLAVITAAQSKSVTTSWTQFSVTVTVPSNSKNLICAIWSDATDIGVGGHLNVAEAGLYASSAVQPWVPRPIGEELALCQRYYEKTYALDTPPASVTSTGLVDFAASSQSGENVLYAGMLAVAKRAAPTISSWHADGTSGTWAYARNGASGTASVSVDLISEHGFRLYLAIGAAWVVGNVQGHWAAVSEL
jgi:hypothetical protein